MPTDKAPHEDETPTHQVIVVGAGIAGLACALRLSRSGSRVLVVERAPDRRSSGYLVNLVGSGYDAAHNLAIMPALSQQDLGWFTSILVKADGSKKFTVPAGIAQAALGGHAITVFRGDLESTLYEAVRDAVTFRFGTTVTAIDQDRNGVSATLSDGTAQRASLIVGADGLHSQVRRLAFGPESDFRIDLDHMVAAFPLTDLPGDVPAGASATFIGPHRTASVVNLGPQRSSAFFTYRCVDVEMDRARGPVRALDSVFGDLGAGVRSALQQLANAPAGAYFDSVSQIVMDPWSRGRVVLLGDAAWCVTLFAGYGAAAAMTGADRLGDYLDEYGDDIASGLAGWEAELRPEIKKRQLLARKAMSRFVPPSSAHVFARDLMMRIVGLAGIRGLVARSVRRASR